MTDPILQKPGAGLPFFERLLGRYFYMPYYTKKTSWDDSVARFKREGQRILSLLSGLSNEKLTKKALIDRITGIEDSSRFWSISMTVEHLIIVGNAGLECMISLSEGRVPPVEVRIENVKPKGLLSGARAETSYQEFLESYLLTLEKKILDRKSKSTLYHPWLGPMNVSQWNWLMASHQAIHRKQIQLILAQL